MSRPLLFVALIALIQFLSSCCCWAVEKEVWEEVSHNVRIMRHRDGTNTEYRRSNDEKTLVKRRLSNVKGGRNSILTTTIYRMDKRGNPLSCKIFDGKENLLYKVAYGYHRETGRLVAEDMFDARVPQIDPNTKKEVPVRRMYWFYDGAGNVTKAFSFVWRKGQYAEELYDKPSDVQGTAPTDNPFRKAPAAAPAAGQNQMEFDAPPPLPPLPFER
ncbi:hypothetical protein [Roseibacillus persicicus]|uniref:hypothetical protein n=1 Tax=Roseibacillus persicicus TaxID=454148 RepID=UPI001676FD68|nr:hypothetical protein [Roseibacillus persicicus]MDQ8190023.1 hypothetical protein [Roseibacillus persicicus]